MDAGQCLSTDKTSTERNAEFILSTMDSLGYSALNLGVAEFAFGLDFLREARAKVRFPFIASNVTPRKGVPAFAEKYVICEIDGVRVGILGILLPELFQRFYGDRFADSLEVSAILPTLQALVPELRNKVDLLILLSDCGYETSRHLVQAVPGIDIAIASNANKLDKQWFATPTGPAVATVDLSGDELGILEITLNEKHEILGMHGYIAPLDNNVVQDPMVKQMVEDVYGPEQRPQVAMTKAPAAPIAPDKQEELSKLSPEQYLDRLKNQPAQAAPPPPLPKCGCR